MPPGKYDHGFLFVESAYLLDVHLRHAMNLDDFARFIPAIDLKVNHSFE